MADGLVNLQTDLKSLRYGSMPLGSDKPYVTKDINNPPSSNLTSMEITKRIDDTSRIAQMLIDRPGLKYLFHEAELKQIGAADKIAKARKGGKSVVGAILGQLGNTAIGVVKIAASTLAQVPVNGTGTHFVKEFRTDTYLQPVGGNNRSKFAQFFGAGGVEGAPLALEGSPIEGVAESNFGVTAEQGTVFYNTLESKYDYFGQGDAKAKKDNENANKTLSEEDLGSNNTSLAKDGKPITIPSAQHWDTTVAPTELGRSTTIDQGELKAFDPYIYKNTYTEDGDYNQAITPEGQASRITSSPFIQGSVPISGTLGTLPDNGADGTQNYTSTSTYVDKSTQDQQESWGQPIQDTTAASGSIGRSPERSQEDNVPRFLPHKVASYLEEVTPPLAYRPQDTYLARKRAVTTQGGSVVRESRVNLGDQGGRNDINKLTNAYWTQTADLLEVDEINQLDIQETKVNGGVEGRDLIKFRFHVITPDSERVLYFRAHLDSFTDNYSGQWSPIKYLGRAEDFQVYSGFQRKISLSFKIAAATRVEMRSLYRKMVYLASATAPTYGGDVQFMRGTIVKLTLGDYVYELPGTLNSLTYTWNQDYPWEIAMLDPENSQDDNSMQELPMVMDCNIDFTPIHTFTPVTGLRKYITSGTSKDNDYFLDTSDPLLDTLATTRGRTVQTTTPSQPTTFGPQPQPTTNAFGFPT